MKCDCICFADAELFRKFKQRWKRRQARKRHGVRKKAQARIAKFLHGGGDPRGQYQPYTRLSTLIGRAITEHDGVSVAEAFELVMRWKEKHPAVSKTATDNLWDVLGILLCPPGLQWPTFKTLLGDIRSVSQCDGFVKLQVCRNQCNEGLFWRDRSDRKECKSCRRPRNDALTFFHRRY